MRHILASLVALAFCGVVHGESPAVVDANGTLLGSYVGDAGPAQDDNEANAPHSGPVMLVVSPTGYLFAVGQVTGKVMVAGPSPGLQPHTDSQAGTEIRGYPYYTTADCSGQAYAPVYVNNSGASPIAASVRGGVVVGLYAPSTALYYAAKTAATLTLNFVAGSARFQSACNPFSGTQTVIPIQPNDPQVTGVGTSQFVPPITLSGIPVPRSLFKDGFENPQASLLGALPRGLA
jgi:hypothetical protein